MRVVGSNVANSLSSASTPAAVSVLSSVDLPAGQAHAHTPMPRQCQQTHRRMRCLTLPVPCTARCSGRAHGTSGSQHPPQNIASIPQYDGNKCVPGASTKTQPTHPPTHPRTLHPGTNARIRPPTHLRWCSRPGQPQGWVRPAACSGGRLGGCAQPQAPCRWAHTRHRNASDLGGPENRARPILPVWL